MKARRTRTSLPALAAPSPAAPTYASAVGGSVPGDSVRRITEGVGAKTKMLVLRAAEVELANAPVQTDDVNLEQRSATLTPITGQANVSTEGVLIPILGEKWKEVTIGPKPPIKS